MGVIGLDMRLTTGHTEIDEQHGELVLTYNRLYAAMEAGEGPDQVGPILEYLEGYARIHFRMEEDLMVLHNYPKAPQHREIHAYLIKEMLDLNNRYRSGAPLTPEVLGFLEDWLTQHINGEDCRLAAHILGSSL